MSRRQAKGELHSGEHQRAGARGCEGRGARVCRAVKLEAGLRGELHRAGGAWVCRAVKLRGNSTVELGCVGVSCREAIRGKGARVCRAVNLRGNSTGPVLSRRQAKGKLQRAGRTGRGARVCRGVKLRGNFTAGNTRGRGRAGVRAGARGCVAPSS